MSVLSDVERIKATFGFTLPDTPESLKRKFQEIAQGQQELKLLKQQLDTQKTGIEQEYQQRMSGTRGVASNIHKQQQWKAKQESELLSQVQAVEQAILEANKAGLIIKKYVQGTLEERKAIEEEYQPKVARAKTSNKTEKKSVPQPIRLKAPENHRKPEEKPLDRVLKSFALAFSALFVLSLVGLSIWMYFDNIRQVKAGKEALNAQREKRGQQEQEQVQSQGINNQTYSNALAKGLEAAQATQIAQSTEEWTDVANLWNEAIKQLEAVPESSKNYQIAQQKATEYRKNLSYTQKKLEDLRAKVNNLPNKISRSGGGIGDDKSFFDQKYSLLKNETNYIRYQDDYLHVSFENNRAREITIQFTYNNNPYVSKNKAIESVAPFLPIDAVKQKEWQNNEDSYVITYFSKSLASMFDADWWFSGKPGDFMVILAHEPYNTNEIYAAYILLGNDPN